MSKHLHSILCASQNYLTIDLERNSTQGSEIGLTSLFGTFFGTRQVPNTKCRKSQSNHFLTTPTYIQQTMLLIHKLIVKWSQLYLEKDEKEWQDRRGHLRAYQLCCSQKSEIYSSFLQSYVFRHKDYIGVYISLLE